MFETWLGRSSPLAVNNQLSGRFPMVFFRLDCGRSVYLSNLRYSRTYASLLEGQPTEEINARILEEAQGPESASRHVVPPVIDHSDPAHPSLPPTRLIVSLVCNDPVNEPYMASGLTVVLFMDDDVFESQPLRAAISEPLRGIDWDLLASDFDW